MIRSALAAMLLAALAALTKPAGADIVCEYQTFQLSDVDDENQVSICGCAMSEAQEQGLRVYAQTLRCTEDGWQTKGPLCLDIPITGGTVEDRLARASRIARDYNEMLPWCR